MTETTTEEPAAGTVAPPAPPNGTALAVRRETHSLPAKIQYAQALADSGLLPAAFRRQPANVLFAIEYGEMLGLSPVAAMMGIYVIDGKPSAYASLISALVRKAHHRLRVGYDEAKMMGWAEIVRCDDPGFTFRSEWDLERAVIAELCTIKDGKPFATDSKGQSKPWRKFFPSMTKARAITECARDACEEALFGLHYTPEELGAEVDDEGRVVGGQIVGAPASQQPDADSWYTQPPAPPWVEEALAKAAAPDLTEKEAGDLWREGAARQAAGEISKADANRIADVIRGRADELKAKTAAAGPADEAGGPDIVDAEVVETVYGLDPEDDWAVKVASISDQDEADAALADVTKGIEAKHIADEHGAAIIAAIGERAAELAAKEAA